MEKKETQSKSQKRDEDLSQEKHSIFKPRASLLSSESSANSYRGFLNLAIILLVITNFRLVVENLTKYGLLISLQPYVIHEWYRWPAVLITASLLLFIGASYLLEILAAKSVITSERTVALMQAVNITCCVLLPSVLIWNIQPNPGAGIIVMLCVSILSMKLISYAHVNHNLRHAARVTKTASQWPENLTLSNLAYFVAAPTLVYQLSYPRTERIRKLFLLRRTAETAFFVILILAIVEQYIVPLVHNSLTPFAQFDLVQLFERLLKLSIPNLYVWLLGFYVFFHLYLNILAELTRFGDRLFYLDWWNSTSLAYYWRSWNMPVHNWMVQHVYTPARNRGWSKNQCYFACFFLSAFFHELIIAVPFQLIKFWSFLGIMAQIPLIILSANLSGNQLGNVLFWFSIVLGQPFLILMMYRAWYKKHFGDELSI